MVAESGMEPVLLPSICNPFPTLGCARACDCKEEDDIEFIPLELVCGEELESMPIMLKNFDFTCMDEDEVIGLILPTTTGFIFAAVAVFIVID